MQVRRQPRAAADPRSGPATGGRTDGPDVNNVNRERLVYCITSLVGHRVTAKLRNNVVYEGLFHSCSLDADHSIVLKCARKLLTESSNSGGELVSTLVIPGKDYLQVSAVNLPPPTAHASDEQESPRTAGNKSFATDSEIALKKPDVGGNRELVPWDGGATPSVTGGLEVGGGPDPRWDQFERNKALFGVTTTWNEDLYTTKLNRDAIPKEVREKAERVAREIENGQMASEMEGKLEADDKDEEALFSAVQANSSGGDVTHGRRDQRVSDTPALMVRAPAAKLQAAPAPLPQLPRDLRGEPDALSGLSRELKNNKRAMVSEMKRINALNLEPTLPKPEDGARNARINFAETQARTAQRLTTPSTDLKTEFQISLAKITQQQETRQRNKQQTAVTGEHQGLTPQSMGQTGPSQNEWASNQGYMMHQRKPDNLPQQDPQGDQARPKQFSFNSQAKVFSLNPKATEFTPVSTGGGATATAPATMKAAGPNMSFTIYKKNTDLLRKNLVDLLEPFFQRAKGASPDMLTPEWLDAQGPSYHEVLGQPNPGGRPPLVGAVPGPGGPVPWQQGPPAPDQPPPMVPMAPGGAAQQMMTQGFVVANAPSGGPPAQMYPQMYSAPAGAAPGPQGQPGGAGAGGMPPQGQQQQVVFGQQPMMAQQPSQSMAMPVSGMGPAVAKFGGQQPQQMVVMPVMLAGPGGYQTQGFVPQQAVQGQPGQQGPPGPGPPGPQAEGAQQGQMMQQQMYHRQSAG